MSDWRSIHEQKNQTKRFDHEIHFGDFEEDEEDEDDDECCINNETAQTNLDESREINRYDNKHNTKRHVTKMSEH